MAIKLGYGNYGMKTVDPFALPGGLASIGFEGVEICAAAGWPTAPDRFSDSDRRQFSDVVAEAGLEFTAVLGLYRLLVDQRQLQDEIAAFRAGCMLARDLTASGVPVVTTTTGPGPQEWGEAFDLISERVGLFADLAAEEGCSLALEAHAGGALDRPDRVAAVLDVVQSSGLAVNFDISHFNVIGLPQAESIRAMAPHAIHVHVKDGRIEDGTIEFLLPGEGDTDYVAYFRDLAATGFSGVVTVEVSGHVSRRSDYDPWTAARFSYETLRSALDASQAA